MTLSSLSNFIPTRLGCMKAWAACNSLDWVTCYPLHFTFVYIVYRESRTRQVVYKHVHYGVHGEMYIGIDSRLIDLLLCCIICSQIKKIRVWLPNQNYWYLVTLTSGSRPCFPPRQHFRQKSDFYQAGEGAYCIMTLWNLAWTHIFILIFSFS